MALNKIRNYITQTWPPRPGFTEMDIPPGSQDGKVFLITGGNAGIGFELCKILAGSGATVYMASRSKVKAEKAIKIITNSVPTAASKIKFLQLDLNDLASVEEAARTFNNQESKLDVLWNNAGSGPNAFKYGDRTVQGFEPMIGIHCIATLLLTELLVPRLKAAAAQSRDHGNSRVVWLGSGLVDMAAPRHGIEFENLSAGYRDQTKSYAASKAGCWILGREMARRYGGDGILSVSVNPGNLRTGIFDGTSPLLMLLLKPTLHQPIFGAYTELFAGLSPDVTLHHNGAYILPWGRIHPESLLQRQDILKAASLVEEDGLGYGNKLWSWCEDQWKPHVLKQ